jgi:hypothetical protein
MATRDPKSNRRRFSKYRCRRLWLSRSPRARRPSPPPGRGSSRDDKVNELGITGLGELGNVGTNAAVANAVYHATGVRLRHLPIRLESLLPA